MSDLQTIGELINFAQEQFNQHEIFFGHGTDNGWDEAVYLVLSGLGVKQPLTKKLWQRKVTSPERTKLLRLIATRVEKRVPSAYLTREAYFAGFKFYVDERVLIPRSPLAELIQDGFAPWLPVAKINNILELGTGSGCIAISCALLLPRSSVIAIDIDPQALQVARLNCAYHGVENRVELRQGDLFSTLPVGQRYDIIISNPPYVGNREFSQLPAEYRHEPVAALLAGASGVELIVAILAAAADYLTPHGILVVEAGNSARLLERKFPRLPFCWLEFTRGEGEVFLLTREQLVRGIQS